MLTDIGPFMLLDMSNNISPVASNVMVKAILCLMVEGGLMKYTQEDCNVDFGGDKECMVLGRLSAEITVNDEYNGRERCHFDIEFTPYEPTGKPWESMKYSCYCRHTRIKFETKPGRPLAAKK